MSLQIPNSQPQEYSRVQLEATLKKIRDYVNSIIDVSTSASAPTHTAGRGALWVTSAGVLYINTNAATTWVVVGSQT